MKRMSWIAAAGILALAGPALGTAEAEGAAPEVPVVEEGATSGVTRSAFTRGIEDREPRDAVEALGNDETRVYYFTELAGLEGQTVVHRWEWNGELMAEVPFEVNGARWRVHSSKNLDPLWLGEWTVSVVDVDGNVLSRDTFRYTSASTQSSVPAAPAD